MLQESNIACEFVTEIKILKNFFPFQVEVLILKHLKAQNRKIDLEFVGCKGLR